MGVRRWRGGRLYTYCYSVTSRMTPAIKMGSVGSHFIVSLIVRDKAIRQCPQTTTFEEKGQPKRIRTEVPRPAYQPNALPLGQTGSPECGTGPALFNDRRGTSQLCMVERHCDTAAKQ